MGPGRPGIPNKRDRIQGKGKIFCGFVFVEMPNKDEADKAIAGLNGVDLKGRPLTANEARPRTGGGGGRDGFGDG
jgi:RNA recognition motif-containing protein